MVTMFFFFPVVALIWRQGRKKKKRNDCQSHIRSLTLAHAFLREKARRDDYEGFKKDNHRFIEEATSGAATLMASSHVGV
jgi:hypothetical protein